MRLKNKTFDLACLLWASDNEALLITIFPLLSCPSHSAVTRGTALDGDVSIKTVAFKLP